MDLPKLAGGKPVREKFLPFAQPLIGKDEIQEVKETLKSGWLSTGPRVKKFEEIFAKYTGAKYVIGINSCTGALHVSLLALGIKSEDEVLVPTLTFTSTAHVVVYVGAKPVFVDIDEDTYNIDVNKIQEAITEKTKAIIPVHYAGHPCDMDEIMKIAKEHDLYVIEDAAHALGAEYKGRKVGSIGDTTCFSFYAIKNITMGEGGAITTNDANLENKLRRLSYLGIDKDAWKRYSSSGKWFYTVEELGYKYNLSDVLAAIGLVQIKELDKFNKIRRKYANYYTQKLRKIPEIKLPTEKSYVKHAWHLYPIVLNTEMLKIDRAKFIEAMNAENIGTSVHFIPLHMQPFYQKNFSYKNGDFPIAEKIFNGLISLPLYPKMTKDDLDDVIHAIKKLINFYRK